MTKTLLPDLIELTFKKEDWEIAKQALEKDPNSRATSCALAQTFIREIDEGRVFHVTVGSVRVFESMADWLKYLEGDSKLAKTYRHDGMRIVNEFDYGNADPEMFHGMKIVAEWRGW